jgi:hypothetical protein
MWFHQICDNTGKSGKKNLHSLQARHDTTEPLKLSKSELQHQTINTKKIPKTQWKKSQNKHQKFPDMSRKIGTRGKIQDTRGRHTKK